jgi:hypothetical protein
LAVEVVSHPLVGEKAVEVIVLDIVINASGDMAAIAVFGSFVYLCHLGKALLWPVKLAFVKVCQLPHLIPSTKKSKKDYEWL